MKNPQFFAETWARYRLELLARENPQANTRKAQEHDDDEDTSMEEDTPVLQDDGAGNKVLYMSGPIVTEETAKFYSWLFGIESFITADKFREAMAESDNDDKIILRLSSPGGLVDVASEIRGEIAMRRMRGQEINILIDGICASAATLIALACENIQILDTAVFMIHRSSMTYDHWGNGNEEDFRNIIKDLTNQRNTLLGEDRSLARVYTKRTGGDANDILKAMRDETYYFGEDAVTANFADEVIDVQNLNNNDGVDNRHSNNNNGDGRDKGNNTSKRGIIDVTDLFLGWETKDALVAAYTSGNGQIDARKQVAAMADVAGIEIPTPDAYRNYQMAQIAVDEPNTYFDRPEAKGWGFGKVGTTTSSNENGLVIEGDDHVWSGEVGSETGFEGGEEDKEQKQGQGTARTTGTTGNGRSGGGSRDGSRHSIKSSKEEGEKGQESEDGGRPEELRRPAGAGDPGTVGGQEEQVQEVCGRGGEGSEGILDPNSQEEENPMTKKELEALQTEVDSLRYDLAKMEDQLKTVTAERDNAVTQLKNAETEVKLLEATAVRESVEAELTKHVQRGALKMSAKERLVDRICSSNEPLEELEFQSGVLADIPDNSVVPTKNVGTSSTEAYTETDQKAENHRRFREMWDQKSKPVAEGGEGLDHVSALTATVRILGSKVYEDFKELEVANTFSGWEEETNNVARL